MFFFKVEIRLHTLIPPFRPGRVHCGSASWDNCGWVLPDKLRVSLFPGRFPHYACGIVSPLWLCFMEISGEPNGGGGGTRLSNTVRNVCSNKMLFSSSCATPWTEMSVNCFHLTLQPFLFCPQMLRNSVFMLACRQTVISITLFFHSTIQFVFFSSWQPQEVCLVQ